MAKAREWVEVFNKVTSAEEAAVVLSSYADETKELIAQRTKNSKPESKKGAMDGALREQKQKFQAICRAVPNFIPEMFDGMVAHHITGKNKQEKGDSQSVSSDPLPA